MKKLIKALPVSSLLLAVNLLLPASALAVCPVCTVAVAGGLGLSRYLGVDDTISGIWIGGLILSSSLWLIDWLDRKNYLKYFKNPKVLFLTKYLIIFFMYLLVLGPLAWKDIIGHPFNTVWGIDKLIVGTAAGTLAFWVNLMADKKVRKLKGKQLFNYQKVVFPLFFLVILSIIMYLITK